MHTAPKDWIESTHTHMCVYGWISCVSSHDSLVLAGMHLHCLTCLGTEDIVIVSYNNCYFIFTSIRVTSIGGGGGIVLITHKYKDIPIVACTLIVTHAPQMKMLYNQFTISIFYSLVSLFLNPCPLWRKLWIVVLSSLMTKTTNSSLYSTANMVNTNCCGYNCTNNETNCIFPSGIVKTHNLGYQETDIVQAVFDKERCPSHLVLPAKYLQRPFLYSLSLI